jgi:hypothetical protein
VPEQSIKDPFEGQQQHRLPGMHLLIACRGGAPLENTLAAHIFSMLHSCLEHDCLIKEAMRGLDEDTGQKIDSAGDPESAGVASVIGVMGSVALVHREWAFLDPKFAQIFELLAATVIREVQLWLAYGSEDPAQSMDGLPLVERPVWAIERLGGTYTGAREHDRLVVCDAQNQLSRALGAAAQPSSV